MTDWYDRLAAEEQQLASRIDALTKALASGGLPAAHVKPLELQLHGMATYHAALAMRLELGP